MNIRYLAGATAVLALVIGLTTVYSGADRDALASPEALSQAPNTSVPAADQPPVGGSADASEMLPDEPSTTLYVTTVSTAAPTTAATTPASTATTKSPTPTSAPTTTAPGGNFHSGYEASFTTMINDHRAANSLPALTRDGSLDAEARAWSQYMASQGGLSHSDIGRFLGPWSSVGENVALGGSVSSIFNGLVASSGHNENMLGDYTHLGVGVWVDAEGTIWTTHVFTK